MNALRIASRLATPRVASAMRSNTAPAVSTFQQKLQLSTSPALHELGSVDHGYDDDRVDRVAEPERRAFTYLLASGARFAYASTARVLLIRFVGSMSASADVLALASAEFDLNDVKEGQTITVKWRGKPIFIRNRSEKEVATEAAVPMAHLRDQEVATEAAVPMAHLR